MREKSVEHLMIVSKLNPQNANAFRYLGHYYARVFPEPQRSHKFYQRALTLNPEDSDSEEAICDLLAEGGKESLVLAVCREASEKSARVFWALRWMGYFQLHMEAWVRFVVLSIVAIAIYAFYWQFHANHDPADKASLPT